MHSFAYTINDKKLELLAESKDPVDHSTMRNNQIGALNKDLEDEYKKAIDLISLNADEAVFLQAKAKIDSLREEIKDVESAWKASQEEDYTKNDSESGFWELGDITISKLMVEYGSGESLYVIPPDIAKQTLSMHCLLSIPRESWPKMIDLILTHNNIGIKKLNPYVKQLYLLKEDYTNVDLITSDTSYLSLLEDTSRIIFVYSPPIENIKTSFYLLDKFKNSKTTYIYQVGSKIAMVGLVKDVEKLITLSENVWENQKSRVSKIVSPQKISPDDAVKLLKSYFGGLTDYSRPMISMKGGNGLTAFALKGENSLVLIGNADIVEQAESVLRKTESQVNNPSEITLYWHTCSHCKPLELAETLSKVYNSLISCSLASDPKLSSSKGTNNFSGTPNNMGPYGQPKDESSPLKSTAKELKSEHFFPFPATGSLLMVVRKDTLGKIKEILKKLDKPKRMVEIEVLLCERRVGNTSSSGINLLKLADSASGTTQNSATFNNSSSGIMEFIFSRENGAIKNIPAIDLSYHFLLSGEDIMVTASPSTTTLNQVPTTLAITDQISISNGINDKNISSYLREDFGITITLTPTIHEPENEDLNSDLFITLENDIRFDTIGSSANERPSVHKRHITNTVRIPDGQTIIIGGLRASTVEEKSQKIPFLGEIPGFAKIFGSNVTTKNNSEMFIFIKPRVIHDPATDLLRIREEKLKRRPGDSDILLQKINESRRKEDEIRFQKSVHLLFGSGNRHEQKL